MTTLAPSTSIVPTTPTQAIRSPRPLTWQTALFLGGWVLLATMVFHVVALVVTGGDVTGPVSLRKPADFAETGWLACWAVALVLPHVAMGRVREAIVAGSVLLFGVRRDDGDGHPGLARGAEPLQLHDDVRRDPDARGRRRHRRCLPGRDGRAARLVASHPRVATRLPRACCSASGSASS